MDLRLDQCGIERERLLLELGGAVETNDRADDDIADLELLADSAGGAGGDTNFGFTSRMIWAASASRG